MIPGGVAWGWVKMRHSYYYSTTSKTRRCVMWLWGQVTKLSIYSCMSYRCMSSSNEKVGIQRHTCLWSSQIWVQWSWLCHLSSRSASAPHTPRVSAHRRWTSEVVAWGIPCQNLLKIRQKHSSDTYVQIVTVCKDCKWPTVFALLCRPSVFRQLEDG